MQQPVVDNPGANRPLEDKRCGTSFLANGRCGSDHAGQQHRNSGNGIADARNSQPDARHGEPHSGNSYSSAGNSSGNDTHNSYSRNDAYKPNTGNYAYESESREHA